MNELLEELKAYLVSISDITAVIGQKVFYNRSPQARATPFLVLEEAGGTIVDQLFDDTGTVSQLINIYAYADTGKQACELSTLVYRYLHTYQGYMGSVPIIEIAIPAWRTTVAIPRGLNSDRYYFETKQPFDIWHERPKSLARMN